MEPPDREKMREAAFRRSGYYDHLRGAFERGYDEAWLDLSVEIERLKRQIADAAQREAILDELASPAGYLR